MASAITVKGISVPLRFDITGYPAPCVNLQVLHDSIFTILSTVPGERVMRPTFGSYLRLLVFEPMTRATGFRARAEVFRALRVWEPRVRVDDVLFELQDTTIILHVTWRSNGNLLAVTSLSMPTNGGG